MNAVIFSILIFFISWSFVRAFRLFRNYLEARKYGITMLILPVSSEEWWWLLVRGAFSWINYLPESLSYWFDFTSQGHQWSLNMRHEPHKKYGDAFVLVTPGRNEIFVNDPKACAEVHMRWKRWTKPRTLYGVVDIFGNNIFCDNADEWQRQRRIVNPAFSEANNRRVWQEALSQCKSMLNDRFKGVGGQATIAQMRHDFELLAMHVLAAAGFGQVHEFSGGVREVPPGRTMSLYDSMLFILTHITQMVIWSKTGILKLPSWLLPKPLREIQNTMAEFRGHLKDSIAYHRATTQGGGTTSYSVDMVSALVRAEEAARKEERKSVGTGSTGTPMYLTDDELFGNLFILNLGGFETTANSMTYALPFLARHPEVQDWVGEEIDTVLKDLGDKEPDYATTFPLLVRCLAVMYETLRLWGAAPYTPRWASGEVQTLCVNDQELYIYPDTYVHTNLNGVNSDPRWWGPDSLDWKPKRWITLDANGQETICQPPTGVPYLAWSIGPRVCPGKKFSQVEFAAVFITILRSYRIKPWIMGGKIKTMEQSRDALLHVVNDSEMVITPHMRRPENAGVLLVKR